jgi:hypothetical protein
VFSRIANKVSNPILVPFGPLAEWLKLSHRLSRHLVSVRHKLSASRRQRMSTASAKEDDDDDEDDDGDDDKDKNQSRLGRQEMLRGACCPENSKAEKEVLRKRRERGR